MLRGSSSNRSSSNASIVSASPWVSTSFKRIATESPLKCLLPPTHTFATTISAEFPSKTCRSLGFLTLWRWLCHGALGWNRHSNQRGAEAPIASGLWCFWIHGFMQLLPSILSLQGKKTIRVVARSYHIISISIIWLYHRNFPAASWKRGSSGARWLSHLTWLETTWRDNAVFSNPMWTVPWIHICRKFLHQGI